MVSAIGVAIGFISENVAHLRLVRVGREEVDIIGPWLTLFPFEIVARMKVDVVAVLGKATAGLPMKIHSNIVVEFAFIKERAARTGIAIGGRGILDEPIQHRQ